MASNRVNPRRNRAADPIPLNTPTDLAGDYNPADARTQSRRQAKIPPQVVSIDIVLQCNKNYNNV